MLIAAASGRALAASARRGGYVPLVADFFGDQDTVATAHAHVRLPDGLAHGMRRDDVLAALERLAMAREPAGSSAAPVSRTGRSSSARSRGAGGCSATPGDRCARERPVRICAILPRLRHPSSRDVADRPADPTGWLVKRKGGAGGRHIRPRSMPMPPPGRSTSSAASRGGRYPPFSSPTAVAPWSSVSARNGRRPLRANRSATAAPFSPPRCRANVDAITEAVQRLPSHAARWA